MTASEDSIHFGAAEAVKDQRRANCDKDDWSGTGRLTRPQGVRRHLGALPGGTVDGPVCARAARIWRTAASTLMASNTRPNLAEARDGSPATPLVVEGSCVQRRRSTPAGWTAINSDVSATPA